MWALYFNIRYASKLFQLRGRSIGLLPLYVLMVNGNDNKQYLDNNPFQDSEHTLMKSSLIVNFGWLMIGVHSIK